MSEAGLIASLTAIVAVVLIVLVLKVRQIEGVPPADEPIENGDGEP